MAKAGIGGGRRQRAKTGVAHLSVKLVDILLDTVLSRHFDGCRLLLKLCRNRNLRNKRNPARLMMVMSGPGEGNNGQRKAASFGAPWLAELVRATLFSYWESGTIRKGSCTSSRWGGAGETGSMEGLAVLGRGLILTARMRLEHKRHALVTTSRPRLTEKQVNELEGCKLRRHASWFGGGLDSPFTGPKPEGRSCLTSQSKPEPGEPDDEAWSIVTASERACTSCTIAT